MLYNDDSPPRDSIGLEMMKRVCQVNKHCACIIMWLWVSKQIPGKKMIDACWFIEHIVQPMCKIFVTAEYLMASCSYPSAYSSPSGKCTVLVHYRLLFPEIYICKLSSFCKKIRHKILCQVYSLEYNLIYSSLARALSCFLSSVHHSSCLQHSKLEVSFSDNEILWWLNKDALDLKRWITKNIACCIKGLLKAIRMIPAKLNRFALPDKEKTIGNSQSLQSEGHLQICWDPC